MKMVATFLIWLGLVSMLGYASADCKIYIKRTPPNAPLILNPTTKNIIYPERKAETYITLQEEGKIELDCPGAEKIHLDNKLSVDIGGGKLVGVTCNNKSELEIGNHKINMATVVCSKKIRSNARYSGNTCWMHNKEIEVGFELSDGNFLQQYTTCFDDDSRNVIYSRHVMPKQIGVAITTPPGRPSWEEGDFYKLGKKVNDLYPIGTHKAAINGQLGLGLEDKKFVRAPPGWYYIAKGHLVAQADFIYSAQQMSSYYYINSAPQWQIFNANNWFILERNVRLYASEKFLDLEVYTGTYSTSTLPHKYTGSNVPLYLYVGQNGKALPIPELFWKLIYDPLNKAGVVILGTNNPFLEYEEAASRVICRDITANLAKSILFRTIDNSKVDRGYMYACSVEDFRRVYPSVPDLNVIRVLG